MYVRPISIRLLRGMLTPAMRAKAVLPYPCRCLCRGFEQITRTAPWRRMILHFSHIGLTEGRTLMVPFGKGEIPPRAGKDRAQARQMRLAKARRRPATRA